MSNANEKQEIIDRYEEAYFRANGHTISVIPTGSGWYRMERVGTMHFSAGRHRLSEIEEMGKGLEKRAADKEVAATREGFVVAATPAHESPNIGDWFLTEEDKWTSDIKSPNVKVYELSSDASHVAIKKNEGLPFKYVIIKPFK
jgi:hypothetical protein